MPTVVVTGASRGIGFATAVELARAGHKVYATMRDPARAQPFPAGLPIKVRQLDVDSDESVRACFAGIAEPVDVLVNNAGLGLLGSVEEMPIAEVVALMNTNYFGAVRCIQAVLPGMRERRAGCIVNISSIAGRSSNSPLGAYCASKHALEAISEALAGEVKPFGIRVAVVEPGIQDTAMARGVETPVKSVYAHARRFHGLFRAALENPIPPETTAEIVRAIIESGTWKLRHPSGPDAAAVIGMRAAMTDEQWIDWQAQDDDAWFDAVQRDFGLDARPKRAVGGTGS